jgi:uncharacterized protein YpmB
VYNYYKIVVSIRIHSIQDIVKNINRRLSFYDILALLILAALLLILTFTIKVGVQPTTVSYEEGLDESSSSSDIAPLSIFASVSGKTYTYSWCQGASRIKEENKIFFRTEDEAKRTGRTLSKLCK